MPSFDKSQLRYFNASVGAGSIVSPTEFKDSQVTVDKDEKKVLFGKIQEHQIPRGAVKSINAPKFSFNVFGKHKKSLLHVNYPKQKGFELRLYLSENAGFKPSIGDYWFIFQKKQTGNLVVGSVSKSRWELSKNNHHSKNVVSVNLSPTIDKSDDQYQNEIYDPTPKLSRKVVSTKTKRDASVARKALGKAKYQCEIDRSHVTFVGIHGKNYVEAHHLIPVSATKQLKLNLDFQDNIVSLCPNCHRAIHHANLIKRKELVEHLYLKRQGLFKSKGINLSLAEIAHFYGI